jgi:apolipoprotein N-acyltransferase
MSTPAATDPQAFQGNRAHELIVATVFAILLPTVFLALRLLARHVLRIRLYFDDWLIIIAWVSQ